jgi:hypothetical protein
MLESNSEKPIIIGRAIIEIKRSGKNIFEIKIVSLEVDADHI